MYAVVEISGQQYAVAPDQTVKVPLMDKNVGDIVEFNNILLASDNGNVSVGTPFIKGSVTATVIEHGKGEKVLVFHKKRRKGYQKLNGHRQLFTSITITDIKIFVGFVMAHKKGGGSTKNGRDSNAQRLGVKKFGGQHVLAGNIIIRQNGTNVHPGNNVGLGKDYTLFSLVEGVVKFERKSKVRLKVSVYPVVTN